MKTKPEQEMLTWLRSVGYDIRVTPDLQFEVFGTEDTSAEGYRHKQEYLNPAIYEAYSHLHDEE